MTESILCQSRDYSLNLYIKN